MAAPLIEADSFGSTRRGIPAADAAPPGEVAHVEQQVPAGDLGRRSVRVFVAVVTVAGLVALTSVTISTGFRWFLDAPSAFWMFVVLTFMGELFPITAPRDGQVEEIGTSTTFGFAILIAYGIGPAALVFSVASAVADVIERKQLWKVAFNVGQYALSVTAAGVVLELLDAPARVTLGSIGAIVVSAVVFFVVNDMLTGVGIALAQGIHPMAFIVDDLWFQASTAAALFAISPVVLIVAERSPWLVPLLVVPVATVYWGATASLEKTRLVTRLKESLEHEKELSRVKDEFVAVVSHELRTPLTSIQGYVKTLLQLPDDLGDEQQRSFLQAVDRQSDRLRRLIEQLLIVGRLESHVEPLSVSFVSFEDLVSLIVEELRPRANGHTFDLRFTRGLPLVETNEAKVHQILSNLVENALKYAPPDTRVTVHAIKTDDGILVTVEDEGPGIPAESQDRVFERFYQVDSSITRSVGGTGLGLYICRKMADTIGARLWLDRSGPDGSAFCLLVPRIPPFDAVRPGERPASLARRRLAQSMTASVWPGSTT